MNIQEDYVSFETAKLLKEKGFDCLCNAYYDCFTTDNFHSSCEPTDFNSIDTKIRDIVSAPTLQMAMKWLRLVHNILIVINGNPSDSLLYISIYKKDPYYDEWVPAESDTSLVYTGETIYEKNFKKYEDACEEAIKHCLTKII
jgi:hypothetical protein